MALNLIDEHGGWVERLPDLKGAVPVALGRHHKQSLYVAMRSRQMPAAPLISEGTSSSDVGTMLPGGFDVARRITAPYLLNRIQFGVGLVAALTIWSVRRGWPSMVSMTL